MTWTKNRFETLMHDLEAGELDEHDLQSLEDEVLERRVTLKQQPEDQGSESMNEEEES